MVGYALGLITTIVIMNKFNAAQPALLYLVPACLISCTSTPPPPNPSHTLTSPVHS